MIYCIYHRRMEHVRDFLRHHIQTTLPDGALRDRVTRELEKRNIRPIR